MAMALTAELEIENIFVTIEFKTDRLPGRGPLFSFWLTYFPTAG
jgi:hypothetical protein